MKFYSEDLKKFFDTAEACAAAEEKVKAEKAAAALRKTKLEAERAARKKEVNKAIEKASKLLEAYTKDYGSFSTTIDSNPLVDYFNYRFPFSKLFG